MKRLGRNVDDIDIAIIGAGIIGCSIAYHLGRMGEQHVRVIEKRDGVGLGSTSNASGGIRAQFTTPINIEMSLKSMKILEEIAREIGDPPVYDPAGYLFVTADEKRYEAMAEAVEFQRSHGVGVELLSAEQVSRTAPYIRCEDILGASFGSRDGFIEPLRLAEFYRSSAEKSGIDFRFNSEVREISTDSSGRFELTTDSGIIRARKVVNAAGAHAASIAGMAGIELPVVPVRRQIVISNPCPAIPDLIPMSVDADSGVLIRKYGERVLIAYANPDEPPGFGEEFDPSFVSRIADAVEMRFPAVHHVGYDLGRSWAGLYAVTPDHHAILGAAPGIEGFYLANGFSGHGNMHSPAVGLAMAELIATGRSQSIDISALALERFERGQAIHETMVL